MIIEVAEGIIEQYRQSRNLNLTGLYYVQAPQDATLPYGVFSFVTITKAEFMGDADANIKEFEIQVNMYSDSDDGGAEISALADDFTEYFNWKEVYVEGYEYIKMQEMSIIPVGIVDEVWQVTMMYNLWIQKAA
tara:strand:+ start:227 stop:628 length:402 start_codon:yes stop_codon:yes gene_type:complete